MAFCYRSPNDLRPGVWEEVQLSVDLSVLIIYCRATSHPKANGIKEHVCHLAVSVGAQILGTAQLGPLLQDLSAVATCPLGCGLIRRTRRQMVCVEAHLVAVGRIQFTVECGTEGLRSSLAAGWRLPSVLCHTDLPNMLLPSPQQAG